jgi:hypothetical protein
MDWDLIFSILLLVAVLGVGAAIFAGAYIQKRRNERSK